MPLVSTRAGSLPRSRAVIGFRFACQRGEAGGPEIARARVATLKEGARRAK